LQINRINISQADNDDIYDLVIKVATTQLAVDDIAQRLRELITA